MFNSISEVNMIRIYNINIFGLDFHQFMSIAKHYSQPIKRIKIEEKKLSKFKHSTNSMSVVDSVCFSLANIRTITPTHK